MNSRIYTLSNGLRIANFSSPHPFTFTDGTVIPKVNDDLSRKLMLKCEERIIEKGIVKNVILTWKLSTEVLHELYEWQCIWEKGLIDYILVPLPVMSALKEEGWNSHAIMDTPFRVIRIADRITKTIHIDKFCV